MDPRLLQYYNLELQHLREMGAEFAQQFPKIAARLGMNGLEVTDPYVERLLEGVGFLAARVHLKLDAEFPRFTQALLESIYPHYLAPTPSMVVAQCTPDPNEPNLASGFTLRRGTTMHGVMGGDDATACEFRTAQDVRLWPVEIVSASYFSYAPDLPLNALPVGQRIKGGVRIRLRTTAGLTFAQTAIDRLTFYLSGRHDVANTLYELCLATGIGALVLPVEPGAGRGGPRPYDFLPASAIHPVGFSDDEALLPVTLRSFQGYRLLQEYFSFPQRFRFFELSGLAPAVTRSNVSELEVVVLFGRGSASLENVVDASNVALFCTPAINLFSKRADRIHVNDGSYEYHVVPDRTRPIDFEVYEVSDVVGYGTGADSEQRFLPFYAAYSTDGERQSSAYFTTRREPRLVSDAQRRRGVRSSYIGSEVFLSLVDSAQAPFSGDLRQLSVQTLCTNRDLVLQMPIGIAKTDFTPDAAVPVSRIRAIGGPSRPYAPLADGAVSWRAISHLSANYLSLVNTTTDEGAAALRDVLELYASSADVSARKQIEGIRSVKVEPVVRRLPPPARNTSSERERRRASMLAFGRGLDITVDVDEMAFEGGSAFLLGSVLAQYFARYVSINAFTQTTLRSLGRGEINQWVPQWGARPTL
jgi:type VI secretion system protein ImpG